MNRYAHALQFGCVLVTSSVLIASGNNTLNNVFYHQGIYSDRIVFYFNQHPQCQLDKTEKKVDRNGVMHNTIQMRINNVNTYQRTIEETLARLQQQEKERGYTIDYSFNSAKQTLLLTISYDPERMVADYATCESISAQRALVINFYHKKVLDLIDRSTNSILHMVNNVTSKPIKVVLDCGHGGVEIGKVGHAAIMEKNINLQVGKQVAQLLRKRGYDVFLTRETDTLVPLDRRTTYANTIQADLFVSIHANAGPANASGLETYWTPKNELACTALNSDMQSKKKIRQCHSQLDAASKQLADAIRTHVLAHGAQHNIKDRKTKKAVSQVLLGTDMPATLVELGFLSHKTEATKLADASYQAVLARGICAGIDAFCQRKSF